MKNLGVFSKIRI